MSLLQEFKSQVVVNPPELGLAEVYICLFWDARHSISMAPFGSKSHFDEHAEVDLGHIGGHRL